MKKELEKFYSENHALIEIVVAFFIISALFLTLQIPLGPAKEVVRLVQFFFLLGACATLGFLIAIALDFFIPIYIKGLQAQPTPQTNIDVEAKNKRNIEDGKKAVGIIMVLLFLSFQAFSILFYLYFAYPTETVCY